MLQADPSTVDWCRDILLPHRLTFRAIDADGVLVGHAWPAGEAVAWRICARTAPGQGYYVNVPLDPLADAYELRHDLAYAIFALADLVEHPREEL